MEKVEEGRVRWQQRLSRGLNPLMVAHQNAWQKLNKYYTITDLSHSIYGAAILVHPSSGKSFFDLHRTGEEAAWKEIMILNVKTTWQE